METTKLDVSAFYQSAIGKKLITGITGLGLILFIFIHMVGNLVFLWSESAYNQYAHFLESLGPALVLLEIVLLLGIVLHAVIGVRMALANRRARSSRYTQYESMGQPSVQSLSSKTMALTGPILLVFLVTHLLSFKYGSYYTTLIDGVEMRDLARLLVEKFQSPLYTGGYVVVMALLGLHLRHGFWSAFQSLGVMTSRLKPLVYVGGTVFAVLMALGFMVLPVVIYFHLVGSAGSVALGGG